MRILLFTLFIIFPSTLFSQDLYPIVKNGKWGYINSKGEIKIEPQFAKAYFFSEGLASVQFFGVDSLYYDNRRGLWGFIDSTGKFIIPPEYGEAHSFHDGLAGVELKSKWGFINHHGTAIIPIKNYCIKDFDHGIASVVFRPYGDIYYLNTKGKKVFRLSRRRWKQFYHSYRDDEGGEHIECIGWDWRTKDGKHLMLTYHKEGTHALVDSKGKLLIKKLPKDIDCNENRCSIQPDMLYGFINYHGDTVIKPQFSDVRSFRNGVCVVKKFGKFGLIDSLGNFLLDTEYDEIIHWRNPLWVKKDTLWAVASVKGIFLTPFEYKFNLMPYYENGYDIIHIRTTSIIINGLGEKILQIDDNSVQPFYYHEWLDRKDKDPIAFVVNKKLHYYDYKGNLIWKEE